jgi:hypothetical protein
MRFEDEALQAALLNELDTALISYVLESDGTISYNENEALAITDAAHRIRDRQFSWYFLKWPLASQSERFRRILTEANMQFFVDTMSPVFGFWFDVSIKRSSINFRWRF